MDVRQGGFGVVRVGLCGAGAAFRRGHRRAWRCHMDPPMRQSGMVLDSDNLHLCLIHKLSLGYPKLIVFLIRRCAWLRLINDASCALAIYA